MATVLSLAFSLLVVPKLSVVRADEGATVAVPHLESPAILPPTTASGFPEGDIGYIFYLSKPGEPPFDPKDYPIEELVKKDLRWAALLNVNLPNGGITKAYCANQPIPHRVGEHKIDHLGNHNIPNDEKVKWILDHGYPEVSLADLERAVGVSGLDEKAAVSATQAAIWKYTNPDVPEPVWMNLYPGEQHPLDFVKGKDKRNLEKVRDYLYNGASTAKKPELFSLKLDPAVDTGAAGSDVGSYSVAEAGADAKLTLEGAPEGIELVNLATGKAVGSTVEVSKGDRFTVRVPRATAAGEAKLVLTGTGIVTAGMGLVYSGTEHGPAQELVVAKNSAPVSQRFEAKVSWRS
ncbi:MULTISPECIES: thioester domain-containing protein, partial [unclassified Corynebacterium]|uniref:thioester domain-containing protein n=1 Tax=unclassified Corynebacterium TaxID=2624378 RepID=UPI0035246AB7